MLLYRANPPPPSHPGFSLILVLLVLLLISAILMGMVMMSNTETNISANFRDEQTAYFASKAGIEEVRDRMRSGAVNTLSSNLPLTALPGAPNGVLYVINPAAGETVAPWSTTGTNYPDEEICKEVTCSGAAPSGSWYATPQSASTTYAASPILPWKWVRVMAKANKSVSGPTRLTSVDGTANGNRMWWTGTNEIPAAAGSCPAANANYLPVYEVTALAVTASGSRRMTQYEIDRASFPPMSGAMIFDGSSPDFTTNPNSNAFSVDGTDAARGPNAGTGCGAAANQPALGGYDSAAVTGLDGQLNKPASYTSGSTPPPAVSNVNSALGPLTTVDGLTNLVNSVTASAGPNVFPNANNSTPPSMGTNSAPVVNVVQGDFTLPGSGAGILLVTGTLTMNGNPSFNGIILVIGKGNVQKNGAGNGTMNGSLLVANLYSDTPPVYSHLIPLGSNSHPGIPTISWNGGGTATVQYDSCWISAVSQSFPYKIVTQRELIY